MSCTISADMFFPLFTLRKCISISWEAPSQLPHSHDLWLLGSAYFYFMRRTVTINMSPPLSALSWSVFPFHMQHSHGWRVLHLFRLSASANFNFIRSIITVDISPPLSTLSECVFSILWVAQSRLICSRTFNYQEVHISISFAAPSWLTQSHHQEVRISISCGAPSWLTCSRHFRLLGSVYFHSMSRASLSADKFPPLLTLRKCVSPFHEKSHHGWHFPDS